MRSQDTDTDAHTHHNRHLIEKAEGGIDNMLLLIAAVVIATMAIALLTAG